MSLALPNTVLNTIVADAIDDLAAKLEAELGGADDIEAALAKVLRASYTENRPVVFGGDNYADEWHTEAEQRGLLNLRTTPEALPYIVDEHTVEVFGRYGVLSERELESRFEVLAEQYAVALNIEGETAASIARTMILPAAARYLRLLDEAGLDELEDEVRTGVGALVGALQGLETANLADNQPDEVALEWATYMRDQVIPAMTATREAADRLEKLVADDLWPLPKYQEILFVK
jgi:glutamine synthetase